MTDAAKPSSVSPRPARRLVLYAAALLAVAAIGGLGWKHWSDSRAKGPEYIFATVQRTDFEDLVSATGALQPRDYVDVGAQVSGQLKKLHVEVGSEVTEGQLLAEIDAEQSAARVDASRASLRAQQAQLAQSRVNLEKAERDLLRLQRLLKEEATTLELVQNAETAVATARAQINTQKAQIEQTQASMRVDESNLKYTKIYAPMAGSVVSITAKQGQTLNANQAAPIILRVADLTTMTVQTQVSEADVSKLRMDMSAYFTTLGGQGRRWHGQLRKIEPTPTVTNNVVLYNALFDVDNRGRNLLPQMTAQVFFVVAEARDALVVPMSALTLQRPQGRGREGGAAADAGHAAPRADGQAGRPGEGSPVRVSEARAERGGEGRPERGSEARSERSAEERPNRLGEARSERTGEGRPERAAEERAGEARTGEARQNRAGEAVRAERSGEPRQRGMRGGAGFEQRAGMPRKATVKVAAADGSVAEREVTVGVSSRVQAQILSGLEEGERVVAGIKPPESQQRRAASQQQGQGMPPGMGGMGAGMGGGRR